MDRAQEMPTSVSWPNTDSTNVLILVRRIPGSHIEVSVHIYILGLEILKAVIIRLSALIKVRQSLTAEASEVVKLKHTEKSDFNLSFHEIATLKLHIGS